VTKIPKINGIDHIGMLIWVFLCLLYSCIATAATIEAAVPINIWITISWEVSICEEPQIRLILPMQVLAKSALLI